jgi:hypothetical protein
MIFMVDNMSIENNLEIYPSGRNEGTTVVVVDKFSKLSRVMLMRSPMNK